VVKADGLAQGKGVFVADNKGEAQEALHNLMINPNFEIHSEEVLIEKKYQGRELSVIALCDGQEFMILGMAQDYKRLYDQNKGPNTGGMGCITPEDFPSQSLRQKIDEEVFQKVLVGLKKKKMRFRGILFAGLMIDENDDFIVLEFNTRFGDPETQTILPLVEGPFAELLLSCAQGELSRVRPKIFLKDAYSIHVVLTSKGYALMDGTKLDLGHRLSFDDSLISRITHPPYGFMAGVKKRIDSEEHSYLVNSGGRVMGITCLAENLELARLQVYEAIKRVHFDGAFWRHDIGDSTSAL
jgi:phosphoribosylamine--glycine ligase